MKKFSFSFLISSIFFVSTILVSPLAFAAMTGGTYKIDSDSINSSGIDNSTFGDYQLMDTIGEIAIGDSTSTNFAIAAGYRQMEESDLSISVSIQNIVLSPDLGGISGGTSTGATEISVLTDNSAGYTLSIESSATPSMQSEIDSIGDYAPAGAAPDYNFVLPVGESVFAFTPEGEDLVDRFRDDGSGLCNIESGSDSPNSCWDGLTTTAKTVSYRGFRTPLAGATTTLKFSAGIGANRVQPEGTYLATTTITVLAL